MDNFDISSFMGNPTEGVSNEAVTNLNDFNVANWDELQEIMNLNMPDNDNLLNDLVWGDNKDQAQTQSQPQPQSQPSPQIQNQTRMESQDYTNEQTSPQLLTQQPSQGQNQPQSFGYSLRNSISNTVNTPLDSLIEVPYDNEQFSSFSNNIQIVEPQDEEQDASEFLQAPYFSPQPSGTATTPGPATGNSYFINTGNANAAFSPSSYQGSYDRSLASPVPELNRTSSNIANGSNAGSYVKSPGPSSSFPRQSVSREEKLRRRRECHNRVERRRRDNIKERITELGGLVPPAMLMYDENGKQVKPNKAVVLSKTVDYMLFLQKVIELQRVRRDQVIAEISKLGNGNN